MSLTLRRDPDARVTALRRDSGVTIWRRFRHRAWPQPWRNQAASHRPVPGPVTGMSRLSKKRLLRRLPSRARRRDHALAEAHERSVNTRPNPGENAKRFLRTKKSGSAAGAAFVVRGGDCVHLAPAASGPVGMCRLDGILSRGTFLIRPLSGGSAPRFTVPGEAAAGGRAHAPSAEGAEVAAAQLPRAQSGAAA